MWALNISEGARSFGAIFSGHRAELASAMLGFIRIEVGVIFVTTVDSLP